MNCSINTSVGAVLCSTLQCIEKTIVHISGVICHTDDWSAAAPIISSGGADSSIGLLLPLTRR